MRSVRGSGPEMMVFQVKLYSARRLVRGADDKRMIYLSRFRRKRVMVVVFPVITASTWRDIRCSPGILPPETRQRDS